MLTAVWFGFAKGEFSVPSVIEKTEDPLMFELTLAYGQVW